ncbi:MAG: hypothetical protein EWV80_04600 [Microcystis aeruginosa Ma_QC_B_20070730_S2]|uniref:Uncharacterized protein n=1 Tax=Microcystis aeruginosa Ma_QC_B_20070730_S2 TaxID=2486256 RepID=A0A552E3B8_MICAE|nr:MAG: hypothetical protein EWV80_04600 [Microcystis aeruginosa Ma_QC_B_20070730_S2]
MSSAAGISYQLSVISSLRKLPTPYTPHPTPHTLHPTPYTPHPTPHTLPPGKTFCRRPYLKLPKLDRQRSLKDHFGNHTLNRSEPRART